MNTTLDSNLVNEPPILKKGLKVDWNHLPEVMKSHYIETHMKNENWEENVYLNIVITCIYAVVMVIGIPSNIMTMVIIVSKKGGGGTMSPTDNYLLNLSTVDVFSLLVSKY